MILATPLGPEQTAESLIFHAQTGLPVSVCLCFTFFFDRSTPRLENPLRRRPVVPIMCGADAFLAILAVFFPPISGECNLGVAVICAPL